MNDKTLFMETRATQCSQSPAVDEMEYVGIHFVRIEKMPLQLEKIWLDSPASQIETFYDGEHQSFCSHKQPLLSVSFYRQSRKPALGDYFGSGRKRVMRILALAKTTSTSTV